ncbi:MAG TPA: class I SAM-dependent methyltransferase [Pseudoxanthomonas sp.]
MASLDLPWWTYPAIDETERKLKRLQGRARVFEYGAGASTVWLAKRCSEVISVEHDTGFAVSMRSTFAAHGNIKLMVVTDIAATGSANEARSLRKGYEDRSFDDYVASISAHPGEFDLIVIDGRARTACLSMAIPRLAKDGVILFDNSDREEYRARIESSGLEERRLRGMAPALPFPSQTSLLERRS